MRVGIDVGGTFTDFVVFDEAAGDVTTLKRPSTPDDPARAALDGLAALPPPREVVHGSTVATNAILERSGARAAFVATAGFADLLSIGRQTRAEIYDLYARRPEPLIPPHRCLEVTERVDHRGGVITPLRAEEIPALVERLRSLQVEAVAVCLLFSFLEPAHESALASALRAEGFRVSLSSEVLPEFREYERASTTAADAYVAPLVDRYLDRLERGLAGSSLRIIQSNGGSLSAAQTRRSPVRAVLSGPAAGVVGALHVGRSVGFDRLISLDMGGTSTDVSLSDGAIHHTSSGLVGGLPIRVPMIDIHTVGAGGGSIAAVDPGGALRVGPRSAGAEPGPVGYGRGGTQPTVTDADLVLGRLPADRFLGGAMPLDLPAARRSLEELGRAAGMAPSPSLDPAQIAALGVVEVVNAHMARALRVVSAARGHDPSQFTLLCFGGAGGLHACDLARSLAIRRVLIPRRAATLSAFGMLVADVMADGVRTVMLPGDTELPAIEQRFASMAEGLRQRVIAEGIPPERVVVERELDMRYLGQSYELTLPFGPGFLAAFHTRHQQLYGHSDPAAPTEIVNLRARGVGWVDPPPMEPAEEPPSPAAPDGVRPVVIRDGLSDVPFFLGERLHPGQSVRGPAVVSLPDTTIYLGVSDRAQVDGFGNFLIEVG
jgi:N-methylhydantoinase A